MSWSSLRRLITSGCAMTALLAIPAFGRADCALTDWLFGHGQTTYAPPYAPPNVYVPPAAGCGCAPVQPVCQPCAPTALRVNYHPVAQVTYMPVVGVDPCSGCAVTTYQPRQTWTYRASLDPYVPYQAAYAPIMGFAGCSSCGGCGGCAPCSGYSYGRCSSCASGGCSSCGVAYSGCSSCGASYAGCSTCSSGIAGGYVTSGGCSSCGAASAPLAPTLAPSVIEPATTIGAPSVPSPGSEPAKTYGPGASEAPISPSAPSHIPSPPSGGGASSGSSYYSPAASGTGSVAAPRIQGIPPVINNGPRLAPPPVPRPNGDNLTTSRPVQQATYFQLLQSSPQTVPAQTIAAPVNSRPMPADDGIWRHADN
jgi:hypothetical protein